MKAFTSLMKLSITVVSLALTAMLIVSAAPLVMGGVNVENTEQVTIGSTGADVKITGEYKVISSVEQDISDLVVKAYLVSRDGSQTRDLLQVGPVTIDKNNPEVTIKIDQSIPIADLAIFFISDNMNSGEQGISLPITISVKGTYSNNLAGVDMKMVYSIPLSQTGSISVDNSQKKVTSSGEVSQAAVKIEGVVADLSSLIPPGGAEFSATVGGVGIGFTVVDDGSGGIELVLKSMDTDKDSINQSMNSLLDAIKGDEDKVIEFEFNGTTQTFNTSQLKEGIEGNEEAKAYAEQIEGICGSLEMFLDKYAQMTGA